jgi:glucose/arabinose dehydrogenase
MSRTRLLLTILVLICLIVSGVFVVRGVLLAQQSLAANNTPAPASGTPTVTRLLSHLPSTLSPATVHVPASMRSDPFTTERSLNIPAGMSISVYARVPGARFMATAPNGDLLVSEPGNGKVVIIQPNANGDPQVSDFVTGLRKPHDIVFHTIGSTTYVYITETNQVNRFIYRSGDTTAHDRQIVVANLPDSSTPELGGRYGHELKNIVLDSHDKLYISIASTCNACVSDTQSDPLRAAIYQYNADGSDGHLFARGLRNAEGLDMLPGTDQLWAVVNNRDNIAYPYHDATGNYGKVLPDYVDNHPPEEFTLVRNGGNYGWPFCNPNADTSAGYSNMPFDPDAEFNADGHVDCAKMDRINKGMQAHSAPLGLTFIHHADQTGALIAFHGSWNRTTPTGYKVVYFSWNGQQFGDQLDLVTGFTTNNQAWGRPVDTAVDAQGSIFISDDFSGTIYKLS